MNLTAHHALTGIQEREIFAGDTNGVADGIDVCCHRAFKHAKLEHTDFGVSSMWQWNVPRPRGKTEKQKHLK